jgi:hypothetical protein
VRGGSYTYLDLPEFGTPNPRFNLDVGTHLVARLDGKPLTGDTVDAMVDFCRYHLKLYFQECTASAYIQGLDDMSPLHFGYRQKVMDQITPEMWKTYLAQWKAEKIDKTAAESRGDRVYTIEEASSGVERMGLTEEDGRR